MKVYTALCLACVLSVTVLLGCKDRVAESPAPVPAPTERVALLMGGHPHAEAITRTGKATAYRITQDPDDNYNEKIISQGVALTPAQRARIADLLARDDAYEWDIAKGCEPMPGVLITFEDGATYARVRLCFGCKMVGFTPGNWEDFDPINDELVRWVKGVFPEDKVVQSLGTDDEQGGL